MPTVAAWSKGCLASAEIPQSVNDDAATRTIVEGYRHVPRARQTSGGDLELRTDSAHADTLRRLEQEEREAGLV